MRDKVRLSIGHYGQWAGADNSMGTARANVTECYRMYRLKLAEVAVFLSWAVVNNSVRIAKRWNTRGWAGAVVVGACGGPGGGVGGR